MSLKTLRRALMAVTLALCATMVVSAQSHIVFQDDISRVMVNPNWGNQKVKVALTITAQVTRVVIAPKGTSKLMTESLTIPYDDIIGMTYDRRCVGKRCGKHTHWFSIRFKGGTGDGFEMELGKDVASTIVDTLEARSGKKVERVVGSSQQARLGCCSRSSVLAGSSVIGSS